jgi:hypothetical protein
MLKLLILHILYNRSPRWGYSLNDYNFFYNQFVPLGLNGTNSVGVKLFIESITNKVLAP